MAPHIWPDLAATLAALDAEAYRVIKRWRLPKRIALDRIGGIYVWPRIPRAILADDVTIDVTIVDADKLDPAARHVMRVWMAHERTRRPGYDHAAARRLKALLVAERPVPKDHAPKPRPRGKGGRPPDYSWPEAEEALAVYADKNALPEVQKRMIEWVRDWFKQHDGAIPDNKDIRKRLVRPLYQRLRGN